MKVSTENDNNFGYEKITIVVDNIPLNNICVSEINCSESIQVIVYILSGHPKIVS
jgi:hypothetical protein